MSNALAAADEVLIPIQCEYYALEGLGLLMQVTDQIRACGANPGLSICGLLMTMFDSRTNLNPAVVREVRNHFQEVVFETVILCERSASVKLPVMAGPSLSMTPQAPARQPIARWPSSSWSGRGRAFLHQCRNQRSCGSKGRGLIGSLRQHSASRAGSLAWGFPHCGGYPGHVTHPHASPYHRWLRVHRQQFCALRARALPTGIRVEC